MGRLHLDPHGIYIDFLIKVIEQSNSLDNHSVHLVGREFELVARERVTETKGHSCEVCFVDVFAEQAGKGLSDASEHFLCGRVADNLEFHLFGNGPPCAAQLQVSDSDICLGLAWALGASDNAGCIPSLLSETSSVSLASFLLSLTVSWRNDFKFLLSLPSAMLDRSSTASTVD